MTSYGASNGADGHGRRHQGDEGERAVAARTVEDLGAVRLRFEDDELRRDERSAISSDQVWLRAEARGGWSSSMSSKSASGRSGSAEPGLPLYRSSTAALAEADKRKDENGTAIFVLLWLVRLRSLRELRRMNDIRVWSRRDRGCAVGA